MSNERPAPKQYEARLIQLLRLRFEQAKFKVEDHLITPEEEMPPDISKLPPLFHYFRHYNVMEVKTEADRLEVADLLKLHAYGWLYMMRNGIHTVGEVTLTALVHHLNPVVLEVLPALGYKPTGKGIFRCDSNMVSYLIPFEGLPDELTPEELQVFSNPARRQPIILSQLERGQSSPILEAILDLYESEVLKLMMVKQETIDRFIETLGQERVMAVLSQKMGREKLLANFRKEELLAALNKEDLLAAFGEEEILKSLQAKLGPELFQQLLDRFSHN
ncbi:hypothetical protein L0337_13540 [candidate division KSB1 bacterium]|nr:hypothetical protein [candidate division KSB1 bacterium]